MMFSQVVSDYAANDKSKHKETKKTKKIIISFDGTGGEPSWGVQDQQRLVSGTVKSNASGLSNISKMHLLVGGDFENTGRAIDDQIALYYSGVGTRGGWISKIKAAIDLGGMSSIYKMALEDIEKCYNEGDKLYLFGFSRGAATARLFSSYLQRNGLEVDGKHHDPKIAFMGVYDTVPDALNRGMSFNTGIYQLDVNYDSWFTFMQSKSSVPEIVGKVVHLVAVDEQRVMFKPTLFNQDDKVTEIWCAGNHSDVGGGYYHDGLSDGTLTYMLNAAQNAGLVYRTITEDTVKSDKVSLIGGNKKLEDVINFDKDMKIEPDPCDPAVHNENISIFWIVSKLRSFKGRNICKIKDDKVMDNDEPVLILDNVIDRMKDSGKKLNDLDVINPFYTLNGYMPPNLKGVKYKIVNSKDCTIFDEVYVMT